MVFTVLLKFSFLTLILLEPKAISLCHQYSARPACTSMQSDQDETILLADQLQRFHPDIPKIIIDSSKNGRWIIPFKKFNKLRVMISSLFKSPSDRLHFNIIYNIFK